MQLLTYVQTKRITAWKNMVHGAGGEAMAYGSKDSTRFSQLKKGDTLWVIASSPRRNPSLVAKIVVDTSGDCHNWKLKNNPSAMMLLNDEHGRFPYVVTGGKGSEFYGYNDAGKAIIDLMLVTPTGKELHFGKDSDRWEARFGHYLQRPIEIADSSRKNPLELLSDQFREKSVFLSWKHIDHPHGRFPLEIVHALNQRGFSVWFDLLALPRSKSHKKLLRNPDVLANLLAYGYQQSRLLLAIDSPNYGKLSKNSCRNWTWEEWDGGLKTRQRKLRIRIQTSEHFESLISSSEDHTIESTSPEYISKKLEKLMSRGIRHPQ